MKKEVPEWLGHVGYRAHYFEPVWGDRQENCIRFDLARTDELPFERNYYIRPESDRTDGSGGQSANADENLLCWFVQGEEQRTVDENGLPDWLRIKEDNLLLLE